MSTGYYIALSGSMNQVKQIEMVANNLANAETVGYKADRLVFERVLSDNAPEVPLPPLSRNIEEGEQLDLHAYSRVSSSYTDYSQGAATQTGRQLDVMIEGDGFFEIQTEAGLRYTRAGNFKTDATGQLVTQSGDLVQGSGGPITITPGEITIGSTGSVTVNGNAVGALKIVTFDDVNRLEKEGGVLFRAPAGVAPQPAIDAGVVQGSLESANVRPVEELVKLIEASRIYEAYNKVTANYGELNEESARGFR